MKIKELSIEVVASFKETKTKFYGNQKIYCFILSEIKKKKFSNDY
jgi:hypothetical protein